MSDMPKKPWYSEGKTIIRKVDRLVSRSIRGPKVGQESDWLGWDGWVRTESGNRVSRGPSKAR